MKQHQTWVSPVPKWSHSPGSGVTMKTLPRLLGNNDDDQVNATVCHTSEARRKTTSENSPLFNPEFFYRIKQDEDLDSMEASHPEYSADQEHTNYVSRSPVSEDGLESISKSYETDKFLMVPESTDILKTPVVADGAPFLKGIKHGGQIEIDKFHGSEISVRTLEVDSLVFDQNIFSDIKKEEESEATESDNSDCSEPGKSSRRKTGLPPTIKLDIKAQETCLGHTQNSDNAVTSAYRKSEIEEMKQQQKCCKESTNQSVYKSITWEKQAFDLGNEGNVGEFRLEKISLYETGFCVIMDPFILQGDHPAPIPYLTMKTKKERKRYDCNECGKRFNDSARLRVHQRIHTGERPFECPTCEKRFMDRYRLVNHIMIHTGEKPHKCKKCDKCFNQRSTLNKHQRTHERKRD